MVLDFAAVISVVNQVREFFKLGSEKRVRDAQQLKTTLLILTSAIAETRFYLSKYNNLNNIQAEHFDKKEQRMAEGALAFRWRQVVIELSFIKDFTPTGEVEEMIKNAMSRSNFWTEPDWLKAAEVKKALDDLDSALKEILEGL